MGKTFMTGEHPLEHLTTFYSSLKRVVAINPIQGTPSQVSKLQQAADVCLSISTACRQQGWQCTDHMVKACHDSWPELRLCDVWYIFQ